MTDIVERLNDSLSAGYSELRKEAAVEIMRLRAKIEQMERQEPECEVVGQVRNVLYEVRTLKYDLPAGTKLYALPVTQPAPSMPEVTDAMALAFHHALTDGSIGAREVEEIKDALRAALAAAPKLEGE